MAEQYDFTWLALAGHTSEQDDVDLYPDIRTGDDVVDFYAKFGQDSPVKFFYCNRWAFICALLVPSTHRSH